jgi:hypothetical protein
LQLDQATILKRAMARTRIIAVAGPAADHPGDRYDVREKVVDRVPTIPAAPAASSGPAAANATKTMMARTRMAAFPIGIAIAGAIPM